MIPLDKGFRNLLPPVSTDPDELVSAAEWENGKSDSGSELQELNLPSSQPPVDVPLPNAALRGIETTPVSTHASSGGSSTSGHALDAAKSPQVHAPSVEAGADAGSINQGIANHSGSGGHPTQPHGIGPGGTSGAVEHDHSSPIHSSPLKPEASDSGGGDPGGNHSVQPAGDQPVPVVADEDDITVVQSADVDQDANIFVHGYLGPTVARIHLDQDIRMDQDADIDLDIDGNGQLWVRIGQDMHIDQDTEIDLDIFDENGVLYVDLYLHDVVEVDQDTEVDLDMRDGHGAGRVIVNQSVEHHQDADIDVDIEDELEERYAIHVNVAVRQDIDTDQDVYLGVADVDGELGVGADAVQTALIDQDTVVKIDFAVI